MGEEDQQNKRGRKPVEEDEEKQDEYLRIYLMRNYYHLSHQEIQEKLDISSSTVERAITWVNDYFLDLSGDTLLRGAIFATEKRISKLTEQFEEELSEPDPSVRSVVELNREIRQDSKQLFELQEIYTEKYEVEMGPNVQDILKALSKQD